MITTLCWVGRRRRAEGRYGHVMTVEFLDHTADVGVRITATSLEALFAEAAVALTATVTDVDQVEARVERCVTLRAADLNQLLVDWLGELVGQFDIEQFLGRVATVTLTRDGDGWRLEAELRGDIAESSRHAINVVVKGVTYHELHIEQTADGTWHTRVVFDI